MEIEKYEHHGVTVSVIAALKGKHRKHCLCYQNCIHFKPGEVDNCSIAQANYRLCVKHNVVTPVFECATYEAKT